MDMSILKKN